MKIHQKIENSEKFIRLVQNKGKTQIPTRNSCYIIGCVVRPTANSNKHTSGLMPPRALRPTLSLSCLSFSTLSPIRPGQRVYPPEWLSHRHHWVRITRLDIGRWTRVPRSHGYWCTSCSTIVISKVTMGLAIAASAPRPTHTLALMFVVVNSVTIKTWSSSIPTQLVQCSATGGWGQPMLVYHSKRWTRSPRSDGSLCPLCNTMVIIKVAIGYMGAWHSTCNSLRPRIMEKGWYLAW